MSGKVFLWSAPRSLSTAFTRAMVNVDGCEVLLEPYWHGHISLWGNKPTRSLVSQPVEQMLLSVKQTSTFIQAKSVESKFVFCKEIAKDFGLSPEYIEHGFQHTFLLRHPERTLPSLYRMYTKEFPEDKRSIDFGYEGGFRQLYEIYEFASSHFDPSPIVISVNDLIEDPEKVLKYYCDQTGLPYSEGMSRWKPGPIDGWHPAQYYMNVFESSGIGKLKASSNHISSSCSKKEYPDIVKKAIQDNIWYFEQLYERRVKF